MVPQRSAIRSRMLWLGAIASLLWLGGVMALDIRYDLFPKTTLGGLKILAAVYLLVAVIALPVAAARRLARRFRK